MIMIMETWEFRDFHNLKIRFCRPATSSKTRVSNRSVEGPACITKSIRVLNLMFHGHFTLVDFLVCKVFPIPIALHSWYIRCINIYINIYIYIYVYQLGTLKSHSTWCFYLVYQFLEFSFVLKILGMKIVCYSSYLGRKADWNANPAFDQILSCNMLNLNVKNSYHFHWSGWGSKHPRGSIFRKYQGSHLMPFAVISPAWSFPMVNLC